MKIFICIEHDVVYRNFMLTGAFNEIEKCHDVSYIFPSNAPSRLSEEFQEYLKKKNYLVIDENKNRQKIWKRIFFTELMWNFESKKSALKTLHRVMLGTKASFLFFIYGIPLIRYFLISVPKKKVMNTTEPILHNILLAHRPNCVIHPTVLNGVYANEIINSCKKIKIPTIFIMNSWDNPSTKGAVSGVPDFLLVWGPQTKNHAMEYMGMPSNSVVEFGATQFDQYYAENRSVGSRIEPTKKKLTNILFAGSSKETDEYSFLIKLDEAISKNGWSCRIVYRPHPWGNCGMNGHLINSHPWKNVSFANSMVKYIERIEKFTTGRFMDRAGVESILDDFSDTDIVISPLSTILLEAALNRILPICLMPEPSGLGRHFNLASPLPHFEDYFQLSHMQTVNGVLELIEKLEIFMAMSQDNQYLDIVYTESDHFVKKFESSWSSRLSEFIRQFEKQ